MKNRQFIILCLLVVGGFCVLGYKQYKLNNRVEYIDGRVSFRAEKILTLQEDQDFTAEVVGIHSKLLRGDKKAR